MRATRRRKPRRYRRRRTYGRCNKARYPDMASAKAARRNIQTISSRPVVPVRVYLCDQCRGYHLTSSGTEPELRRA